MQKIYAVHKWVSLVCALFLLLLALTGLPLLFRGEINAWNTLNMPESGDPMPMEEIWQGLPEGTAAVARAFPDKEILGVTPDASDGTLYFLVKDRGGKAARSHMRMGGEQIMYDVRTLGCLHCDRHLSLPADDEEPRIRRAQAKEQPPVLVGLA